MDEDQVRMHLMISSAASNKQAAEVYNKAAQWYNFPSIHTMQDAMSNKCLSLVNIKHKLKKKGEPDQLNRMLTYMITTTAKSFSIARNIHPDQIPEVAEVIENEFFFLKLSEVYFILKQGKMGRNGKMFEGLDLATIVQWFDDYVAKRMNHAEEKALQYHDHTTHHERARKYDGFITNLHQQQYKAENEKVKNLAYTMAKKMIESEQKPKTIHIKGITVDQVKQQFELEKDSKNKKKQ